MNKEMSNIFMTSIITNLLLGLPVGIAFGYASNSGKL